MSKVGVIEAVEAWELSSQLRLLITRLNRTLREKAGVNQRSLTHTSVLIRLERNGSTFVTELARAEDMRQQSMSAIIADMEVAGLVRGTSDPSDGRRTIISLTDAGWSSIKLSRAERHDWLAHMISKKFSAEENRRLITAIALLELR